MKKAKFRWGAVVNAIVGTVALLSDPHVFDLGAKILGRSLPEKLTAAVTLGSLIVAAVKKPVVRAEHERVL